MAKPKRRFYQFRLRTLLALVALASIAMSWFTVKWNQAKRQRAAVESIVDAGGAVVYQYQYGADGDRIGNAEPPGPTWLRRILGVDFLSDVHDVLVVDTEWADAGLEHLAGLKNLESLALSDTRLTDEGVKKLQQALPNCTIQTDAP